MSPVSHRLIVLAVAFSLVGCASKGQKQTNDTSVTTVTTSTKTMDKTTSAGKPAPVVIIKGGSTVTGKLNTTLDSGKNADGDTFSMPLAPGLFANKTFKGAQLEGHVEGVKSAAKFGKKGELDVVFDDIKLATGEVVPVEAKLAAAPKPQGKKLQSLAIVMGSALVGHHVGKSLGKKHGLLGGAAAGAAIALTLPGGNVVLKKGDALVVKFTADVKN
jgi:hypothetical protein